LQADAWHTHPARVEGERPLPVSQTELMCSQSAGTIDRFFAANPHPTVIPRGP